MSWEVRTMRSGTSFFNSTLYRKTMLRFWPLWAAYGLMWLYLVPFNLLNNYFSMRGASVSSVELANRLVENARDIPNTLQFGVFVACGYGVLCAMAVFGYLYNNRSACMMHALPLRRETLFGTQYLAGLSFALLPNLVVAGITLAVELPLVAQKCWGTSLASLGIWLLVQSGVCLFFFSFAAFCAMFTGHILALPAFYGILNMLAYVLNMLINGVLSDFFFGFSMHNGRGNALTQILTPIWPLTEAVEWDPVQETVNGMTATTGEWYLLSPGTVAAYAAAGVVLAVLALLVYRQRQVESAGDVVSVRLVRPVFLYGVAFCSGLCFGVYTIAFFGWRNRLSLAVCVVVWAVVGYFVARMLLCKSFRVLKYWKGAAASFVVMAVLCVACFTDVMGITAWVPQVDEVASITVVDYRINYPYDSGNSTRVNLTDREQIAQIVALHQAIVDHRDTVDTSSSRYQAGEEYTRLDVEYALTDGRTVRRSYDDIPLRAEDLTTEGTVTWALNQIAQDRDAVEDMYDFDRFEQYRLVEAYLDRAGTQSGQTETDTNEPFYLEGASNAQLKELWQAVRADFDAGTIGVRYLFDDQQRQENTYVTDLVFVFEVPSRNSVSDAMESYSTDLRITLTPNAENTLAWLTQYAGWGETVFPILHEVQ
jgi:ABC-2 type transport system permease protein